MVVRGTLKILNGYAFLIPDSGQPLTMEKLLMMMKDVPPNGSAADRIKATPDYFRKVLGKRDGDSISITAELQPFGSEFVLVVAQ